MEEQARTNPTPDIEAARLDPNAFIQYCFTDDQGAQIVQAPHHREWQTIFGEETHVALLGAAELGKTQQVAFRLVWELGHDPESTNFIISAQQKAAMKILGVASRAIAENPRVRQVFPDLKPGRHWSSQQISVQRRNLTTKDFSVEALGWDSRFIGIRARRIIVDDVNDIENSRTEEQRQKIVDRFDGMVQTRLLPDGQVFCIGNAWHQDDLIHQLARRNGFFHKRYSVIEPGDDGIGWRSIWPERFPLSRVQAIRERMPALAFQRAYMCIAAADETARFELQWFTNAKQRGIGMAYAPSSVPLGPIGAPLNHRREPLQVYVGVDLGSGRSGRKSDHSVLFAIAYDPPPDPSMAGTFVLLEIRAGRFKAHEILAHMGELDRRYEPIFCIEDNGTQELFVQIAGEDRRGLRVAGLTTTIEKWDPITGVESLALDFERGRWVIPSGHTLDEEGDPAVAEPVVHWLRGLYNFSPADAHTPDDVMAGWLAVKAARKYHRNPFAVQRRVGLR